MSEAHAASLHAEVARLEAELCKFRDDPVIRLLNEELDAGSRAYAQSELNALLARQTDLESELEDLATAGDSITRGGLIMEIRAGTGGEEAALFARDLFDMYAHFIESRGWKLELIEKDNPDWRDLAEDLGFEPLD